MAATLVGALIGVMVGQILLAALAQPLGLPPVRDRHRGDARPRRGHRLRAAHHRPLPRAGGGGRQHARRVGQGGRDVRRVRRRGRADRHGRDRRPARHRHPADRQARHRRRDRRRRRRRVGADDPADHDRRARALAAAEEGRARPALARLRALGRDRHRAPVAVDRRRRARCCWSSPRRSRSCASASPTTATSRRRRPSASPTTSSARRSARARTARSCSPSTRRRATADTQRPARPRCSSAVGATPGRRRRRRRPQLSHDGEMATIFAIPTTAPQDERTSDLLERLREDVIPGGHPGHAAEGLRRRQHRGLRGLLRQGRLAPAAVHRGRHRAVRAAADRGLPLAVDPARLGGLQPAVGRRRLRRRRGRLPGGRRREPARRRQRRADRLVHPGDALRDPVRAEHGLQRLPALAGPRGLQRGRPAARERDPRHGADRQGHPVRRPDHGLRCSWPSSPSPT